MVYSHSDIICIYKEFIKNILSRIGKQRERSVSLQDDLECQEGNPLGASYLGRMNGTTGGRTVYCLEPPQLAMVIQSNCCDTLAFGKVSIYTNGWLGLEDAHRYLKS